MFKCLKSHNVRPILSFLFPLQYMLNRNLKKNKKKKEIKRGLLHNFTICMEIQKTLNSQSNLEKEEWNWRNQPA